MNKIKVKFIILILAFLLMLCVFNINTVNAATLEDLQKMLDLIPDEIYLDIPEIEYEKANDLIKEQVKQILNENDMNTEGITMFVTGPYMINMEQFYKARISLQLPSGSKTKDISITYNNTNNKNSTDEQYIKNLKHDDKGYFEMDFDDLKGTKYFGEALLKVVKEQAVKDDTVTVMVFSGAGSDIEQDVDIGIFKNGILYDIRSLGWVTGIPVINVPKTMPDNELSEYVINQYKDWSMDYGSKIIGIEKGDNVTNEYGKIPNIYTVKVTENSPDALIIIRRTDSSLQLKDESTNIRVDTDTTVLPENTQLIVNELKEGQVYETATRVLNDLVDKMYVYDITLQNEGVEVQPNGNVKVSIPIPNVLNTSNLIVYTIDDEGNKTEYEVKVETIDNVKYATFETDHFSTYVLAEEKTEQNTVNENGLEVKGEKDNTPKTGTASTTLGMIALVSILGIGIIVLIKKHK